MIGVSVSLLFVVGCWSIQWKPIRDFEETFREYSGAAIATINSIENILESSRLDTESFLNHTFSKSRVLKRISKMKSSEDKCTTRFVDEDDTRLSHQIQIYQLQIPLRSRIIDISERLNDVNSSFNIYQGLVESKFQTCSKSENENCLDKTNEWLETTIGALSCAIYPNCSFNHSIRKRSTCSPGQFSCINGGCISGSFFCDSHCHCGDCSDRPPGCVRHCNQFRCQETFRCISLTKKCNGIDDCGDGSDEDGCPTPTMLSYTHVNCSFQEGNYLCGNNKCVGLEQVCDGYNDCGDWSDEGDHCTSPQCSPECTKKGGVCFTVPKGSECLYECPPGTFETSKGCSRNPETSLPTLLQILEDTPRLLTRYSARLKYLKTKTIIALSKALRDVVQCKKEEFTLLSKVVDYSTLIYEDKRAIEDEHVVPTAVEVSASVSTTRRKLRTV